VLGNQAYLFKVKETSAEITWEITGVPSMRKNRWLADSFNLVGFNVDSESQPSFAAYFAPSPAHDGQAMYRLNNQTAKWVFVHDPTTAKLKSGEAYWVYCEGSSNYQGPLRVDLPMSGGLLSGALLSKHTITFTNISSITREVNLVLSGSVVLYYREWNVANGYFTWKPINEMPSIVLQPESSRNVWLEVRRGLMVPGLSEALLKITDSLGIRIQVPVSAEVVQ
jgi:hypothetical protein